MRKTVTFNIFNAATHKSAIAAGLNPYKILCTYLFCLLQLKNFAKKKTIKNEGNKIYFITARLTNIKNCDSESITKDALNKYNIKYDKLIINGKKYHNFNFKSQKLSKVCNLSKIEKFAITENMSLKQQEIAKRNNKIIDLLEQGDSISDIAKKVKISLASVYAFIAKNNINIKEKSDNIKELILKRLWAGEPIKRIAKSLNSKEHFVKRISKKSEVFQSLKAKKDNEIIKLIKKGYCISDIMEQCNISETNIRCIIRNYNSKAKIKIDINTPTKKREEEIKAALIQGMNRKEVAKKINVSIRAVDWVARKHNIYRTTKEIRDKKIIELASKGIPISNIAESIGVSECTVKRLLNHN